MLLLLCQPYGSIKVQELPTFKINDYFKQNCVNEGEEVWQAYMRVIRAEMAKALNFKLSENKMEDKLEYKKLLYPGKYIKVK